MLRIVRSKPGFPAYFPFQWTDIRLRMPDPQECRTPMDRIDGHIFYSCIDNLPALLRFMHNIR